MKPKYRITIVPEGNYGKVKQFTKKHWGLHIMSGKLKLDESNSIKIRCIGFKL